MEVRKIVNDNVLKLFVSGKLSATTADDFSRAVEEAIGETQRLVLDFEEVSYLASSGLRVLISAQKKLEQKKGSLTILHVNSDLKEVFEITGLDEMLDIQ
jgi:anti-anti-sigma factor